MNTERPPLTVKQLAQELQVTPETVRRWVRAGTIDAIKVGRVIRIPAHVVDQHRQERQP